LSLEEIFLQLTATEEAATTGATVQ